jgi:predicted Zn-dependent peptidase
MRFLKLHVALTLMLASAAALGDGITLPAFERTVLENGTVLLLNEKHDVPLIGLEAIVRGGATADPQDKHGLASLLARLLVKGANERSSAEFADAVASVGGQLDASAGLESLSVSAEFMSKDAALMVELLADALQRPALDRGEFEKLRDRSINLIKSAKGSDPNALMPSYANAFLFGEHPYGNPVDGSESSLARITHGDLLAYYADRLGGDRLVIAVSGDFEIAAMRDALTAAFSGWRAATATPPEIVAPEPAASSRVYLIDKPGATQSYFTIGNVGVARSFSGRAELDLANTVFGGRFTSMLMTELRTKSGLSYSARSKLGRYSQSGSVFVTSFTETGTTVEALDVALATLSRLRDSGLDGAMIASSRNYIMGQFPPRLETAAQLAGIAAMLEINGLDAAYINDYGSTLAAATPESIAAVIDQVYPAPDRLVFVVLGDAASIREQVAQYGPVTEISLSEPRFHP